MAPPGRVHRGPVPDGQQVGRAVRDLHAGAGGRELHERGGEFHRRMIAGLVLGAHAQRRRVVVGAHVQAGQAGPARGHDRGQRQYRGRGLDLHLQPDARAEAGTDAQAILKFGEDVAEHLDLLGSAHFR